MDDSHSFVVERTIDAPADKIWNAWKDPEKIARWWGPAEFYSTVKKLEVFAGGHFDVVMHGPDGTDYANLYIFNHVEPYKQLIYTNMGSQQFDLAPFQSVVDMESLGDRTRVRLTARFGSEEEERKHVEDFRAVEGSRQLLQRLEEQSTLKD